MLRLIKLFKVKFVFINLLTVLLLSGCTNRYSDFVSADNLALSEVSPQTRFDQEVMIVRLSQVLLAAKLSNSEYADLHFERGVLYDSLGLWSLARYDFATALEYQPKMAAAYNYLGLYLLLEDNYDSAIDAFNAVLDLDPEYAYTYLNRGLAFYYSGRYSQAERDLQRFYASDPSDPYRVLWLYFNDLELNPMQAVQNLQKRAKLLSAEYWGTTIVQYFLGGLSLEQLRQKIDAEAKPDTPQYAEILTETYFYLAKQKLKLNQVDEAASLFRLALANQVYNFVEYRFAQFELSQLRANQADPVVVGKN